MTSKVSTEDKREKHNRVLRKLLTLGYRGKPKPLKYNKFGKTAKLHVDKIIESGAKSAFDIGCGTGGILLALQHFGIEKLYGVDLSPEGIDLAKKRFELYGDGSNVQFFTDDVVNIEPPTVDSVSLHQVVCCYPDVKGILAKSIEANPKTIILTFPWNRFISKIQTFLENMLLKLASIIIPSIRGVRSYLHSASLINEELENHGYRKVFSNKGFSWQTDFFQYDKT